MDTFQYKCNSLPYFVNQDYSGRGYNTVDDVLIRKALLTFVALVGIMSRSLNNDVRYPKDKELYCALRKKKKEA